MSGRPAIEPGPSHRRFAPGPFAVLRTERRRGTGPGEPWPATARRHRCPVPTGKGVAGGRRVVLDILLVDGQGVDRRVSIRMIPYLCAVRQ